MDIMLESVTDGQQQLTSEREHTWKKVFSFDEIHGVHGVRLAVLPQTPHHQWLKMCF